MLRLVLSISMTAMVSCQFCASLHADFLRRQGRYFNSSTPFDQSNGAKHTPYITVDGTVGTVTVGTASQYHPMTASNDQNVVHFVTHIYVLDQDDGFVAMSTLDPTGGGVARMEFDIPSGATQLVAYEWCNLHGLWKGPEVNVSASVAANECEKPSVSNTSWASWRADFHRRQQLFFNSAEPFTEADGKKHTPYTTINGDQGKVIVGNNDAYHPMINSANSNSVHFVTHIYVLDQNENIIVMENMDPTDVQNASITFSVPFGTTALTAYEWCNLHGLWKGPTVQLSHGEVSDGHRGASHVVFVQVVVVIKLFKML